MTKDQLIDAVNTFMHHQEQSDAHKWCELDAKLFDECAAIVRSLLDEEKRTG